MEPTPRFAVNSTLATSLTHEHGFRTKKRSCFSDQKNKNTKWFLSFPFFSNKNEQADTHTSDHTLPGLTREDFIPHKKLFVNLRKAFLNNDTVKIEIKFNSSCSKTPRAEMTHITFDLFPKIPFSFTQFLNSLSFVIILPGVSCRAMTNALTNSQIVFIIQTTRTERNKKWN